MYICIMEKRTCKMCGTSKDIKDFGKSKGYVRGECKVCRAEQAKKYRTTTSYRERYDDYHYSKNYNISSQEYYKKVLDQNNCCKICGKKAIKKLVVDHNHTTGKVRDLLCNNCNTMIGLAKENPYILQSAMNYLFIHNG